MDSVMIGVGIDRIGDGAGGTTVSAVVAVAVTIVVVAGSLTSLYRSRF